MAVRLLLAVLLLIDGAAIVPAVLCISNTGAGQSVAVAGVDADVVTTDASAGAASSGQQG